MLNHFKFVLSFINFQPTQQIQQIIAFHYGYCNMFRLTSHHQANLEPLNISEFWKTIICCIDWKLIKLNILTEHNGMNILKVKSLQIC
jgi:hypothetical protein